MLQQPKLNWTGTLTIIIIFMYYDTALERSVMDHSTCHWTITEQNRLFLLLQRVYNLRETRWLDRQVGEHKDIKRRCWAAQWVSNWSQNTSGQTVVKFSSGTGQGHADQSA